MFETEIVALTTPYLLSQLNIPSIISAPNKIQPTTRDPIIDKVGNNLVASCQTEGANIGFKFSQQDTISWKGWRPYTNPIAYKEGIEIEFKAHRLGYLPSKKVVFSDAN